MRRALIALAVALVLPAVASAAPPAFMPGPQSSVATAGSVTATLSYTNPAEQDDGIKDMHLQIARAGAVAFDADLTKLCDLCQIPGIVLDSSDPPVHLVDLDGDGEPEALVDTYSGGAHCCFSVGIFDFRPDLGTYGQTDVPLGNGDYDLKDDDGDGRLEINTFDDRFAYAFTAYAASAFPPQIFHFQSGETGGLTNVTRSEPGIVQADAADLLPDLKRKKHGKYDDRRGILAAYVADESLLGTPGAGLKLIAPLKRAGLLGRAHDGFVAPAKYRATLVRRLRSWGYAV